MKIKLRKLELRDADALAENTNDELIAMNLIGVDFPYRRKDSISWIKDVRKEYTKKRPESIYFGIDVNGLIVGEVGLYDIDYENKNAEIVFWIGKEHRGKGIVTKAVKEMLDYGFEKIKLVRIFATVFTRNKQSVALLEKLKFEYEGKHKKVTLKDGKYLDEYTYAKINPKYNK
jgi:RimJ/RimL family protein N-acetyltransferase